MKTFALIAAAAMAVSTANAVECVLTEIAPTFIDILPDVEACSEATGYYIVPPSKNPTTQQAADICTKCAKLVTEAKTKTFPTCTLNIDGVDTPLNEFFNKVVGGCGSASAGSSAGSGAATSTTIETPAPTTAAPAASTSPSNNSSSSASSPTVPTPAPSTTTAGSAGVVASVSAAVVAVATVAAYAL